MRETRIIKVISLLLIVGFFAYWIFKRLSVLEERLGNENKVEEVDSRMEEAMAAMQNYLQSDGNDVLERLTRSLQSSEQTRKKRP